MMEKKCIKCKCNKFIYEFSKDKNTKDGYNNTCKICHSKYRKEHYLKNKEKVKKQVYTYKKENPEKFIFKFANRKPNKRAGRTIKTKCSNPNCNIIVFVTKKDIKFNEKRYCSNECKRWNYHPINSYIQGIKKNAKRKNLDFDITKEFLEDLLINKQNGKCIITNVPLKFTDKTKIYETPSLDRIDSNKGYTKDNVQWVMLGINYMKLNHPNNDLKKALKLIVENYR